MIDGTFHTCEYCGQVTFRRWTVKSYTETSDEPCIREHVYLCQSCVDYSQKEQSAISYQGDSIYYENEN
jgi:hypothetical protein